jgi:hypothetical protein
MSTNPWKSHGENVNSDAAIQALAAARLDIERNLGAHPTIRKQLIQFSLDISFLAQAYRRDPAAYRLTRSFAVVHLPAIMEILQFLRSTGGSKPEVQAMTNRLAVCFQSAAAARKLIEDGVIEATDVSLAVLERQVLASLPAPTSIDDTAQETTASSRMFAGASRFAKLGLSKVTETAGDLQDIASSAVSSAGSQIASRSTAGASLVKSYAAGALEDGVHAILTPVTTRVKAAAISVLDASISGVMDAGLMAIIFPPAVPFAVGMALLDAPMRYEGHLATLQKDADKDRARRLAERQETAAVAMAGLRGLAEVVRVETPYISMSIETSTGLSDGTILAGQHRGSKLSELDAQTVSLLLKNAPDAETKSVLQSWQRRVAEARS